MISAFGVNHGLISKASEHREKLPENAGHILPASTVRAYDHSKQKKKEAALINFASQAGGGAAGTAAGITGAVILARKRPGLFKDKKIIAMRIPSARQKEAARYVSGVGGATLASLAGSSATTAYIKRSKRYDYGGKAI
jgi:hypothetical protein